MPKTIVITGASTGIGAAIARRMARDNTIIIHYCNSREPAEEVARDVETANGTAHLIQADLSSEAGCNAFGDAVYEKVDTLDVLVNNAGGLIQRQEATELTWDLMSRIFALNTFSTMKVSSLLIPLLRQGTLPTIINMTSIAARHGAPTATIYGACKGALDSFTRGLAKELAPDIRVNAVAPGVIETPFHKKVSTPEQMETWASNTPLGRNGVGDDIAQAVDFLVHNTFTTGETVDVNGGLFMR